MSPRTVHARAGTRHVPDLLQALFAAELVRPSRCLWLVSPWVSDIPVLDNRAGGFATAEPGWPRAGVRLGEVLLRLLRQGTAVCLATRPDDHNRPLLDRLAAEAAGLPLRVHQQQELHAKGLLADDFFLSGSMNFTYSGVTLNEELLTYVTDPAEVARQQVIFRQRWGGRS